MTGEGAAASEGKRDRDIIIDDRILRPEDTIHELTEVYEEPASSPTAKPGRAFSSSTAAPMSRTPSRRRASRYTN